MMLYRSKTALVRWPLIFIATFSGTPARTMLRTAVRRKSWKSLCPIPAAVQAVAHDFLNSPIGCPSRWKT